MYIERVPNRNSRPAILLREGWREGKKTFKHTIANLTNWPEEKVEALRLLLRGEPMVSAMEAFMVEPIISHGHVEAVLGTIKRLGLDSIIFSKRCRERDLVLSARTKTVIFPNLYVRLKL